MAESNWYTTAVLYFSYYTTLYTTDVI